jgi:hypothetical protein
MAFKQSQAVALKSNIKYRGVIYNILPGYSSKDPPMFNVQWTGGGCFLYPEEMLISKEEADKLIVEKDKKEVV